MMKITKSVNLKKVIIDVGIVDGDKPLTAKENLIAEAVELGIDTADMTSAQLQEAIAAAK